MTTKTLSVPDISCGHCKESIEGAVNELSGVSAVEVSIEDKTVEVSFNDDLELERIVGAINEQGYDVASA